MTWANCGCLLEDDWRIIGPTETGPQPFNPGGEIAMWTSRDQGRELATEVAN